MKVKKILFGILLAIVGMLVFCFIQYRGQFGQLAKILSSYSSKEICTCTFILELNSDYCVPYGRVFVDLDEYFIDTNNQKVHATIFGESTSAVYRGPRLGCFLTRAKLEDPS